MSANPKATELTASPELDALVAEKVMGWHRVSRRDMGWGPGSTVWSTGENPEDPNSSPTYQDFRPSTDIAAAYQVAYALTRRFEEVDLNFRRWTKDQEPEVEEGEEWYCGVEDHDMKSGIFSATAETLPLAICRAALKAVGHE